MADKRPKEGTADGTGAENGGSGADWVGAGSTDEHGSNSVTCWSCGEPYVTEPDVAAVLRENSQAVPTLAGSCPACLMLAVADPNGKL